MGNYSSPYIIFVLSKLSHCDLSVSAFVPIGIPRAVVTTKKMMSKTLVVIGMMTVMVLVYIYTYRYCTHT